MRHFTTQVFSEKFEGISDDMVFNFNHTHVGDTHESFIGAEKEDGLFTTADLPFTHYIDPIDNSLTYALTRDVSPNKYYDVGYSFTVYKCFWPGCTPPTTPPPTTPPAIDAVFTTDGTFV